MDIYTTSHHGFTDKASMPIVQNQSNQSRLEVYLLHIIAKVKTVARIPCKTIWLMSGLPRTMYQPNIFCATYTQHNQVICFLT